MQFLAHVWAVLILLFSSTCRSSEVMEYDFDIPRQSVELALNQLAEQTGALLIFPYDSVQSVESSPVSGRYTLKEALKVLLLDTSLSGGLTGGDIITVSLKKTVDHDGKEMNHKKQILVAAIGFLAATNSAQSVMAQDAPGSQHSGVIALEEIIVTATKRETSLQDTAATISVLDSSAIEKRGLVGMDDYLRVMPGVDFHDRGAGQNTIVIRGLSTDPQAESSTSGVYFGETPVTDLGAVGVGDLAGNLDIKLVDIERVEVLKGPQGSLYGSSSMGGAVRIIPAKPNVDEFEGKVAMTYSSTSESGGSNTMMQGVINLPVVEDQFAVRAVAYRFSNSGYVENVINQPTIAPGVGAAIAGTGVGVSRGDIGSDEYTGFRISMLWQPVEELDITLSYLDQEIDQDGFPEVNLFLPGPYQQERLRVGSGGVDSESLVNDVELINLVVNYDLGWGNLSSSSSWIDYSVESQSDLSSLFFSPVYAKQSQNEDLFIEEIRLTSSFDGAFQFIGGMYYEDRESHSDLPWLWSGDASLDSGQPILSSEVDESLEQFALFGEFSWALTEQLTATLGMRYFDYENSRFQPPFDTQEARLEEDGETYKINLSYAPNDNTLIYAQWAQGFRLGSARSKPSSICDADNDGNLDDVGFPAPDGLNSDSLDSYELGAKMTLLEERLTLNATVYRTDWENVPVTLTLPSCNGSVALNAGKSQVEGVELEAEAFILDDLHLNFSVSYSEAILTEDAPNIGSKGDNLPGSADFNASIGMEYQFDFAGYPSFVLVDYAYVDEYYSNVAEVGQVSGGYSQLNAKAGLEVDKVHVDLFVNNLTNADEFTWTEVAFVPFGLNRAYRLRPRTVGLNIGYRF